ncbi:MAG: hypothetical protein ACRETW_06810 [Stenotrophobium sp.]
MKILLQTLIAASMLTMTASAYAHAGDQYLINELASGSPESIREAASDIYENGNASVQVLDALAEALLENLDRRDRSYLDALSWSCKALGRSGNRRYYSAVKQASEGNRKLKKYCGAATDDLQSADGPQYTKGMTTLSKGSVSAGASNADSDDEPAHAARSAHTSNGHYQPISAVQVGMTQREAYAIAGEPTAETSHMTGKAFIPFNFKGSDTYRIIALYKGQGRIAFHNTSSYSRTLRVLEVQIDPSEGGYP